MEDKIKEFAIEILKGFGYKKSNIHNIIGNLHKNSVYMVMKKERDAPTWMRSLCFVYLKSKQKYEGVLALDDDELAILKYIEMGNENDE